MYKKANVVIYVTSTKEENVKSNSCHQRMTEAGCRSCGGGSVCCHGDFGWLLQCYGNSDLIQLIFTNLPRSWLGKRLVRSDVLM